ncbi:MAG: MFS transporter [Anaerolineae bacterium]
MFNCRIYPIYLAEVGRQNLEQIGLLNAAWGVATILASLLAGWLTDRLGERPVIVAGFAVEALGLGILLRRSAPRNPQDYPFVTTGKRLAPRSPGPGDRGGDSRATLGLM